VKGMYHVSMKTGIGTSPAGAGGPHASSMPRGRIIPSSKQPSPQPTSSTKMPRPADVREPMVDVFNEQHEILVVVELPGVHLSDIRVEVQEDILRLETTTTHPYATEIPCRIC